MSKAHTLAQRLEWGHEGLQAEICAELRRLHTENVELYKYAERYRHLREHGDTGCTEKDGYGGQTLKTGEDLDVAVDKVRKETK